MTHTLDPLSAEHVRASFARQNAMGLIHATMPLIEHGRVEIQIPHWSGIEQQHGFVHGGVVGMIADSAGGYAAMTLIPANASVLTVEYKMNFVAPAKGEALVSPRKYLALWTHLDRDTSERFRTRKRRGISLCRDAADNNGDTRQTRNVSNRPIAI
jgi:uncharacterized protein (TIGR00369 family)